MLMVTNLNHLIAAKRCCTDGGATNNPKSELKAQFETINRSLTSDTGVVISDSRRIRESGS